MNNPASESFVRTQWGTMAPPFASYSIEERRSLLQATAGLLADIKASCKIECFLSYGALLGAVRTGSLIDHDFDIDVVFMSSAPDATVILDTSRRLVSYLADLGFDLDLESNGQIRAHWNTAAATCKAEFFVGWTEDENFYQYFAIQKAPIARDILPLSEISVEGIKLPCPRNPETSLRSIYGPNWRVPDPNFRYELSAEDWKSFEFLFLKKNQRFWNKYYEQREHNAVFVRHPSQFCIFTADQLPPRARVLDFGCGNGRDGLYLASSGFTVTLADYSEQAVEYCRSQARQRSIAVDTKVIDIADMAQAYAFEKTNEGRFDAVYARFFFHAVDEVAERNFLRVAYRVLCPHGKLFAEYRLLDSASDNQSISYENGHHYRRLIRQNMLLDAARAAGFTVDYSITGVGLATYKSEDPFIGRVVLSKRR